jgi:flagellar basal-body rod modification protein FlgD
VTGNLTGILQNTQAMNSPSTGVFGRAPIKKTLDKDDFLKLLTTQLRYQDPEKTQDSQAMMAQLAQFSSLEQMQNLNKTFETSNQTSQLSSAASLIGKMVEIRDDAGNPQTGQVTSIRMVAGEAKLMLGLRSFDLKNLVQVR